jgi:hypothetical protein
MHEDDADEVRIGTEPRVFAVVSRAIVDSHGCGSIPIRIDGGTIRASSVAEMVLRPTADLADYFQDLARNWRGWPGDRTWNDDDGQVSLKASHDGVGAVHLEVELQDMAYQGPGNWRARAIVPIEPGVLDRLAGDLRALLSGDIPRR